MNNIISCGDFKNCAMATPDSEIEIRVSHVLNANGGDSESVKSAIGGNMDRYAALIAADIDYLAQYFDIFRTEMSSRSAVAEFVTNTTAIAGTIRPLQNVTNYNMALMYEAEHVQRLLSLKDSLEASRCVDILDIAACIVDIDDIFEKISDMNASMGWITHVCKAHIRSYICMSQMLNALNAGTPEHDDSDKSFVMPGKYVDYINWKNKHCVISSGKVIARHADGSVKLSDPVLGDVTIHIKDVYKNEAAAKAAYDAAKNKKCKN